VKKVAPWTGHWTRHLLSLLASEVIGDIFGLFLDQQLFWGNSGNWLSGVSSAFRRVMVFIWGELLSMSLSLLFSGFIWKVSSCKSAGPLGWWLHDPHLWVWTDSAISSSDIVIRLWVLCPQHLC
jgi:hypothetical protein